MIHMIQNFYEAHKLIINILISLTGIGMYLYNLIAYRDTNLKSIGYELIFMIFIPYLNTVFLMINGMSLYINIITKHDIIMQKEIEEYRELEDFLKVSNEYLSTLDL